MKYITFFNWKEILLDGEEKKFNLKKIKNSPKKEFFLDKRSIISGGKMKE